MILEKIEEAIFAFNLKGNINVVLHSDDYEQFLKEVSDVNLFTNTHSHLSDIVIQIMNVSVHFFRLKSHITKVSFISTPNVFGRDGLKMELKEHGRIWELHTLEEKLS